MKSKALVSLVFLLCAACTEKVNMMATGIPQAELSALALNPFDPQSRETSVDDSEDAFIPNLTKVAADHPTFISRCTKERYYEEMHAAIEAAKNDPDRRTIPVRYSISVGTFFDDLAYYAHRRSILRADTDGITPIAVGAANDLSGDTYMGANALHYFVDHMPARKDFIDGTHCYFDTVRIQRTEKGTWIHDGTPNYNHMFNILYYGDTYDPNDIRVKEGLASPRLFKPVDSDEYHANPQIVPLYIADFRDDGINSTSFHIKLLSDKFVSSAIRRHEYWETFKQIFSFRTLWTFRDQITKVLATDRNVVENTGEVVPAGTTPPAGSKLYAYSAYEGVPQLIDWIVFSGLDATMMATQYTPLVLDLGTPNIRTSSLKWGTFFNLAGLKDSKATDPSSLFNVSHMTAWLGGYVVDSQEPNSVNVVTNKRRNQDGFLILRPSDGKVGQQQLLGASTPITVNGATKTYPNGFDALAALGGKNCGVADTKQNYIGPWDGDLYTKTLAVWVDANRNGVAEADEISSLPDAHVGAINACFHINQTATDKFGNTTNMRAAFLLMDPSETTLGNDAEILKRLKTGKTLAGVDANFRVMIDILFQTNTSFYLEDIDPANITQ